MRSPGHSGGCRLCWWHLPDLSALFAQRQLFQAGVKTPMGKTGPTPLRKIDITWHDCSFLFRALPWFWVTGWTHGDNDGEREWKNSHEWRCISYQKWGFSNVIVSFYKSTILVGRTDARGGLRGVGLTRAADSSKKPIGQPWGSWGMQRWAHTSFKWSYQPYNPINGLVNQ